MVERILTEIFRKWCSVMELLFHPQVSLDTISGFGVLFDYFLYLPGNCVISFVASNDRLRHFFEITPESATGIVSLLISCLVWWGVISAWRALCGNNSD